MRLSADNVYTMVVQATADERSWLEDYLTLSSTKWGVEATQFLTPLADVFPTGLLNGVVKGARREGIKLSVSDRRIKPDVEPDLNLNNWLRGYQADAVRKCISRARGIIWSATASGKTEIFCSLADAVQCDWLFVVNRFDLVRQAADRYESRVGEPVGRVYRGGWTEGRITFATLQTLHSALKSEDPEKRTRAETLLHRVGALCVDEVHRLPAATYYKVAMQCKSAYYRFGMSATPLARGDRKSSFAIAAIGPVIVQLKTQDLIEEGWLSKPRIMMVPVYQESRADNHAGAYRDLIVDSATRNQVIVEAVRRCEKPALVFVQRVKHGKKLRHLIEQAGAHEYGGVEFVWGEKDPRARQRAAERLQRGDTSVVVCNVVWEDGVDVPDLRSVVIAGGGESAIASIQRIGRGMRVTSGKSEFAVWDVLDSGNKWLHKHALARRRAYRSEGHQVEEVTEMSAERRLDNPEQRGDVNPLEDMVTDV